jgi:hypothetical protein
VVRARFRQVFGLALIASALFGVACGIDFVGGREDGTSDADASSDGGTRDVALPMACTTLDASCLGALPDIWKPIAIASPACGAGFAPVSLIVNPRNAAGSCACGACQAQGAFTCSGTTAISGGNSCGDSPIAQAQPGKCTQANAQHIMGSPPAAGGSVTCSAPNDAGTGVMVDGLSVCVPGCSADFCGSASRCVIAEGEQACPSGFKLQARAGIGADPGCPACECEAGVPGSCTGNVVAFASNNCTDSGIVKTYAVGTCNVFPSGNYSSVLAAPVPPTPQCFPVAPPSAAALAGDASLLGAKTICCQ